MADVIIVDKDIFEEDSPVFRLMKYFESSENILLLVTNEVIDIPVGQTIDANVHHLIDYN